MIIDFHTHAYTDALATRAAAAVPKDSPYAPSFDCTIEGLKKQMQRCGIDKSVVLNIANKPENTTKVNDFALSLLNESSIIPFGSVHPYYKNYKYEFDRLWNEGIRGIKFQPYTQKYYVNDPIAFEIYETALNMGFIILFHCGYDLMIPGDYGNVKAVSEVASSFKGAKIVAAHLGGWKMWDEAAETLPKTEIYVDCSFSLGFLTEAENYLSAFDEKRILFGTDTPWANPEKEIQNVKNLKISDEFKDKIFYKNALKLLKI